MNTRAAGSSERQSPASDRNAAMPPIAPPRTSSSQQAGSSRRANQSAEKIAASPRRPGDGSRSASRGEMNGAGESSQRAKRNGNSYTSDPSMRPTSRDSRAAPVSLPIHPHPAGSSKPSREASENLIRAISNAEEPQTHDSRQLPATTHVDDSAMSGGAQDDQRRSGRSRHDHSRSHKATSKFGDFILGNTIGEGEFGKVKLGWKQDSNVQVAIKLIKRDTVGTNPSRLAKIRREVTILRGIHHPNIVQLIDMVETDRYIGIILEYASGGELFDYILNHRYLKDNSARRLFSQLVSGVGYLHKKGIVHRDLKLENLLLDKNRNIIITDFGFANTFDPHEELAEEEELNLSDKDWVKRAGLDRLKPNGMRKGDLMQTSCGSPCYAAPELVVSDSLYTGRKVDVWSCGVILYAMLAGYLPFDDDPANPEGDNINLLYKYIVSTPLTFPEYVTPHARDLLRRILVPNPRKRADLFEVARHSWLSEYAHLVEFITSSTTLPSDIQNTTSPEEFVEPPMVTRSASVRENAKQKSSPGAAVGGLAKATGKIDPEAEHAQRTPKDAKRRTVQVEYVAPSTQTQRGGEQVAPHQQRTRSSSRGPEPVRDKPLPLDPPVSRDGRERAKPPSAHKNTPTRPTGGSRAFSDDHHAINTNTRPQTGGSMSSATSMGLQNMSNYGHGQPLPPAMADTNAQGRIQQPANGEDETIGRPSVSVPPKFARMSGFDQHASGPQPRPEGRGHKRSNTLGEIGSKLLGRSGSVFGGRNKKRSEQTSQPQTPTEQAPQQYQQQQPQQQSDRRRYPPVSMSNAIPMGDEPPSRPSMDSRTSRRSFSLGIGKKRSGSVSGSHVSNEKQERRRFSLLPPSFSFKEAVGLGRDSPGSPTSERESQPHLPIQDNRGQRVFTAHGDARGSTPFFDDLPDRTQRQDTANSSPVYHQRHASAQLDNRRPNAIPSYLQTGAHLNTSSDSSVNRPPTEPQMSSYQNAYASSEGYDGRRVGTSRSNKGVLSKNKKFSDYEEQHNRSHEGSSGAARRVMQFFRRRGREDRS